MKTALITGISGQDGAYLADFLLRKGCDVHGLVRWDSYADPLDGLRRLEQLGLHDGAVTLHTGDLTDSLSLAAIIKAVRPLEIYNLASLSQVHVSFGTPSSTLDINTKGPLALFEAVRLLGMVEDVRIYQASSSEMFGSAPAPQNENTPFEPCSPYGVAKLAAYWLARTYRDSYGMHISNGILFNHESPLRGEDFVTRKITHAVASIDAGFGGVLSLGNLDSIRDWGHARDYVEGMWLMLQQVEPGDYVLATGEAHTVREFVVYAFSCCNIDLEWVGHGSSEKALDKKTGRTLVNVDPALFRPKDVCYLLGDAAKARSVLGWSPHYYFQALVADMLEEDRLLLRNSADVNRGQSWKRFG